MSQNTSSAVMAQRSDPLDSLDFFPTPAWATRALIEHVLKPLNLYDPQARVWDPACGEGHMVRPLREFFGQVDASDIHDYGKGFAQFDFLNLGLGLPVELPPFPTADWIITNPPFKCFDQFALGAVADCNMGVALFGRVQMLEGIGRHKSIYEPYHGRFCVAPFAERVPLVKGRVDSTASSASAYAWLVITPGREITPLKHIPPCRAALEREGDYQ